MSAFRGLFIAQTIYVRATFPRNRALYSGSFMIDGFLFIRL